MSTNGSPPKTVTVVLPGGQFGSQQSGYNNSESLDNSSTHGTRKDSQYGKHTNQYHSPQGYGYPPLQQPFPGTPQFYHQSPFNVTHISQSTSHAIQGFPSYGWPWQEYDLHKGGDGGFRMIPPPLIPRHGPSSLGAPRVTPGPPGNHPVNRPTSSSSTPAPQPSFGIPGKHPISLEVKRFQLPAESRKTHVAGIANLAPLQEMSYEEYDVADEYDDSSDLGSSEGKPPISLKQTEFSLNQSDQGMGQANYSAFNKWKKEWVAGFLGKKHGSSIRGQNRLNQVWDAPLHWETAVADFFVTFDNWLQLVHSNTAEWVCWQWVGMIFNKCASKIWPARR